MKTTYELEKNVRERSLCLSCRHHAVCVVVAKLRESEEMLRRRLYLVVGQCGEYDESPADEDDYLGVIR